MCCRYCYLTWASWAASSRGMQDEPGAKSANWLCEYVCGYVTELSTSFSIRFCPWRCTSSRQVGFLCAAAQLCKFRRVQSHRDDRRSSVSQMSGLPQIFDFNALKWVHTCQLFQTYRRDISVYGDKKIFFEPCIGKASFLPSLGASGACSPGKFFQPASWNG